MGNVCMFYQELTDNSYYIYSEEIELVFAAINILEGEKGSSICSEIYGKRKIEAWKKKYAFLTEVFGAAGCSGGMLEHLTDYPVKEFALRAYCEHLLQMDTASFLSGYFMIYQEERVRRALEQEEAFEELYREYGKFLGSYLGCKVFFRETGRIIKDFFALAEELDTEAFRKKNEAVKAILAAEAYKAGEELKDMEPLEYSQKLMGKVFHNRGPYEKFYFAPSMFLPCKKLRYFGRNQILFSSQREYKEKQEMMLKQLKALGDDTRFKIIALLNEKEPLRGLDIARELSMAPSTISHHMEQLKGSGLLNEEQDKSSKYYSISRDNSQVLLDTLKELLAKKS